MKAGLAVMLRLAQQWEQATSAGTLHFVFYAREEGPYLDNELGDVLVSIPSLRHADLAVMLEPTDNALQLGCAGTLHAEVRFEGKSAHSARPWQGTNAIHRAAGVLQRIANLSPEWVELEELRFANVVSVTTASGGVGRNVVPPSFVINVNHRFAPGVSSEAAQSRVIDLVGGDGSVRFTDVAPSALPHRTHPLVAALEACGVRDVEAKQAWTDVARFAAEGVPAVNCGPGHQAQAHQTDEWASESLVEDGYRILQTWLEGQGHRFGSSS